MNKTKTTKRLLSLILTLVITITMLPVASVPSSGFDLEDAFDKIIDKAEDYIIT